MFLFLNWIKCASKNFYISKDSKSLALVVLELLAIMWLFTKQKLQNIFGTHAATSSLYYKQVTIIIYDCNDSGQYYKTTITIVIDDPSLS